jgi:hypothetical protein
MNTDQFSAAGRDALPRKGHFKSGKLLPRFGFAAILWASMASAAQPEVIRCLPPDVPITNLPEAVLIEYRAEIRDEFERYFSALSAHIDCLDAERDRALSEAREATETYSAFLNSSPAQKDLQ